MTDSILCIGQMMKRIKLNRLGKCRVEEILRFDQKDD